MNEINNLKNKKIEKEILLQLTNNKVFITVWRLIKTKNHNLIIKSLKKIYDTIDKKFKYIIIGDWPEKKHIKQLIKKLWLENNIILLWIQKNVFKYINASEYFLFWSSIEWFPNVLGEAIACNKPIITSNFETWSQEIILWEYKNSFKWPHPHYGPNGVLIDLNNFESNLIEVYKNLDKLTQKQTVLDKFINTDFINTLFY